MSHLLRRCFNGLTSLFASDGANVQVSENFIVRHLLTDLNTETPQRRNKITYLNELDMIGIYSKQTDKGLICLISRVSYVFVAIMFWTLSLCDGQ